MVSPSVFFGRQAEIVGEYLKKGRSVHIEGRLKARKYTDKDGIEKYATDIVVSEMQMLGSRQGMGGPASEDDGGGDGGGYQPRARSARPRTGRCAAPGAGAIESRQRL